MNTVHFVRHGENPANLTREFSCRIVDYSLTERGIAQAERTAATFADAPVAAVYASPLKRAYETAEVIARPHRLPVRIRDNFREVDVGALETCPPTDEAWAAHDAIFAAWAAGDHHMSFPDGESLSDIYQRMSRGIEAVVRAHPGQEVVVVAHGGILAATVGLFCPDEPVEAGAHILNCAITTLAFTWQDGELVGTLHAWASSEHLGALAGHGKGEDSDAGKVGR